MTLAEINSARIIIMYRFTRSKSPAARAKLRAQCEALARQAAALLNAPR